jgi:hypothetical protein
MNNETASIRAQLKFLRTSAYSARAIFLLVWFSGFVQDEDRQLYTEIGVERTAIWFDRTRNGETNACSESLAVGYIIRQIPYRRPKSADRHRYLQRNSAGARDADGLFPSGVSDVRGAAGPRGYRLAAGTDEYAAHEHHRT